MIYRFLQWVGGIALHWFYRDVVVIGADRIPAGGPVLLAVNHQNALVDAVVAQWVVPQRRLRITAKATIADNPFGAALVRAVGIIPLRRTQDERSGRGDPMRNREAFGRIIDELALGGMVLIFPEGKSHSEPGVAPLKSGLARAALRAREAGVHGITIVPVGLTFEDKARPGTVVAAQVGAPLDVDAWPGDDPQSLTAEIAERLRVVSMTADLRVPAITPRRPWPVALAAWWGRVTHKIPIELARRLAIARSTNADEPAMYTMTYGLGLTLLAYAVQVPIVWTLLGGWVALFYIVSLLIGAYWAAYAEHD